MPFLFVCEHCGNEIVIAEQSIGAAVICNECGAHLSVPEIAAETDQEPNHKIEAGAAGGAGAPEQLRIPDRRPAGGNTRAYAELETRTLGGFLDDGFSIYSGQFWKILALVAVPSGFMFGLGTLWAYLWSTMVASSFRLGLRGSLLVALGVLVIILVGLAAYGFAQGALVHAVSQWHIRGSVSLGQAFAFVRPRLPTLILARLLVGLQLVVVGAVGAGLFYAAGPLGGTYPLAALIAVVFGGIMVYLWVRWVFVEHAVILEGCGVQAGLARSELHVKGYWWRVFFIVFVMGLITLIAVISLDDMPTQVLTSAVHHIVRALVFPLYAVVVTLVYFDLRLRKEGYKAKDLMSALGTEVPSRRRVEDDL